MVVPPSKLNTILVLAAAAATALTASAAPIEANAFMALKEVEKLTVTHPARGAPVQGELAPVVVPADPNAAIAASLEIKNASAVEITTAGVNASVTSGVVADIVTESAPRSLEVTSNDLARLEAHFGAFERNAKVLKSSYGAAEHQPIAWPGGYWPVYADSINYRWKTGEASPAEKYAKAFGLNVKQFQDLVSKNNGIDGWSNNRKCSSNADCKTLRDGSACARREGSSTGYCIPTWFGICHAWAPAAILEPEPKCDVVKNGVTFRAYDIKGLVTAVYDGANIDTVFTGARFNGPDEPAKLDKYGRYIDEARRDLGAGFFHLAVTNIMGKFKQSFVVDVTAGAEVWNQPVRSYRITDMTILSPEQGSKAFFGTDKYPFNDKAKFLAKTTMQFSYIVEANEDGQLVPNHVDSYTREAEYEYFLELDAQYNVIGGEWLGESRYEHPDFLWLPTGRPNDNAVTAIGLSYKEVRALVQASSTCQTPAPATTQPAVTTPAPVTTKPAATTPAPVTTKPATTTPAPVTTKPAATTPAPVTTKPATTTPAPVTTKPAATTPAPVTTKPTTTTPAPVTTKPAPLTKTPSPNQQQQQQQQQQQSGGKPASKESGAQQQQQHQQQQGQTGGKTPSQSQSQSQTQKDPCNILEHRLSCNIFGFWCNWDNGARICKTRQY
ncbi:hypothetical protein PINS_up011566 [Pythium insidiosum]|nr:hypothetical protein PINS_up011566 [Pythium insidiosum]